jgi:MFS family permease
VTGERAGQPVLAAFLVGLGSAWNGGNVGPAVGSLSAEFDVSLAAVGLLSGTVFFAAIVAERIGVTASLRWACILSAVGNVIFAVGPSFAVLAAGRVVVGLGLGLAFILAPVFARGHGGVRSVGILGASIQLGIAGGLLVGSLLADADVDWRVAFGLSALIGASGLLFLSPRFEVEGPRKRPRRLVRGELRDPDVWRLALLFIATLSVPLIVGAWLVHYLGLSGMAAALAGALSFVLFAASSALRFVGGRLSAAGLPAPLLAGCAPLLAAVGLALLALDQGVLVVLAAVLLMGAGFALPYAVMMVEGQWLFPAVPVAPISLLVLFANALPVAAIPLVGAALQNGNGEEALLALAAVVALAGLLNLRPPSHQIEVEPG